MPLNSGVTNTIIDPNWRTNMSEHHRYSEDYTAGAPKTDIKAARALSHSNMIDHLNETDEGVRAHENVN